MTTDPRRDLHDRAGGPRALLVDWGGVLTAPLDRAMWSSDRLPDLDLEELGAVLGTWLGDSGTTPVHLLERGEITVAQFEAMIDEQLAARGAAAPGAGVVARLMAGLEQSAPDMLGLVRRAKAAGLRTALLSNSWGNDYPEHLWRGAFDAEVVSGRVGMRKPEARIFEHTAALLGVPPHRCVMVDDMPANVAGAVAVGMVGVRHVSYEQTCAELEVVFDLSLAAPSEGPVNR